MNPLSAATAKLVRHAVLRAYASVPGVRVEYVDGCPVLIVVATSHVRCRIDGTPVAQVEAQRFLHDGERLIRHRVGGALVAAVHAVDGTVVRSGRQHYLIADGALVPIDKRAYQYLLRLRTPRAVAKVIDGAAAPMTRGQIFHVFPKPNAPGGAA